MDDLVTEWTWEIAQKGGVGGLAMGDTEMSQWGEVGVNI